MAKRLLHHPKVVCVLILPSQTISFIHQTVKFNTIALEAKGDGNLLNAVHIKNVKTGEESDLPVNGLFYAIGGFHDSFLLPFLRFHQY